MVVNDLYIECIVVLPSKTDTPLPADPDAELTFAVALQRLANRP
jgi:hypothetical protein